MVRLLWHEGVFPELRVREGIYLISNVDTGNVIETVDHKPFGGDGVHTYLAPCRNGHLQTQLWSIQKKANREFEFMIRSMATGLCLDVFKNRKRPGAKVVSQSWNGGGNQTWRFWGTRQGIS